MTVIEMLLYGLALSMDAFAVAVCKGLAMNKAKISSCAIVGAWFGVFQGLMPFLGFCLGSLFAGYIESVDHWVAFALLSLIGVNMIKESFEKDSDNSAGCSLAFKIMFVMALATSIDALAVGITFSMEHLSFLRMLLAVSIIGITTFILSFFGVKVGNIFGTKYKSKAEFVGGAILILLGIKILVEGLI